MPLGLKAFMDYNPIRRNFENKLYRSFYYGKNVHLIILDTRQYRTANNINDGQDKTMLGQTQLYWLKEELKNSTATWKFIVSSVPLSIPSGSNYKVKGRDGWGNLNETTGFEFELDQVLQTIAVHNIKNIVWLTTDVHFAAVFKYNPFQKFFMYEVITGPLSADFYPKDMFDPSYFPERLFYYAKHSSDIENFQQAKEYFNYGTIAVAQNRQLKLKIKNTYGHTLFSLALSPQESPIKKQ